ncbi:hypothetical protein BUALT_Bualt10G0067600 [Buddleja alternifolia]|uniref:AAA+ ATPase domain-containing protein n=1 Tax=Buddleja alternifolia TaxID=168488 RepID=A0AAV6WY32_9LAMI|nr:hypothetical protein BUALT_Bualt10G0067600 [Buddleja alternifolia]
MYSTPSGTVKPLINLPTIFPNQQTHRSFCFAVKPPKRLLFNRYQHVVSSKASSNSKHSGLENENFVTRVLRENPCEIEPKYLIGNKLYTLKEKENLRKKGLNDRALEMLKRLNLKALVSKSGIESANGNKFVKPEGEVYLKDLLREYKGKLYVPEQVFGASLSEEEECDKNVKELPRITYKDFKKHMMVDKIKEMRLDEEETQDLLEAYKGPRNEIETQIMSRVGKLPEYPHPVASKISSRMMVELGVVTAAMAAAAVVVGGFLASAVFAVTSFIFAVAAYVMWPVAKPFLKLFLGLIFGILERIWDNLAEFLGDGGISSKLYEVYTFGGVSASIEMLKPIMLVFLTMVLLVRFTLSRRPKDYTKWDFWQMIEFSQSKPQARVDGSTGVMFSDVAGIEGAQRKSSKSPQHHSHIITNKKGQHKSDIKLKIVVYVHLVKYLKNPELFDKMGIKPPHGVLLEGPPGCGKTLFAKTIAGEAGVPFYQMAGPEFVEVLSGVGSARIRDLFKRAKAASDLQRFKTSTIQCSTQERETTLNQLLIELDGFDTGKGVVFLGATNRMDLLDPALLHPGRFDRKIRIRPPNAKGRLDILKVHARKVRLSDTVDLASYANNLPGWTGAKLAQLLQEAALVAVRKGHAAIVQSDMDDAVDRLTMGPKRVVIELGHQGQCRRAITELGTALTSHLLRRLENAKVERCDRVSIQPRGRRLSQVVFHRLDDESYMFERRPQLLHRLQVFLGGRAAEEVIFGHDTSKASVSYLADASWLARKIITVWNMERPMVVHGQPPPWRKSVFVGPRIDFEGSLYDDYDLIEPPVNFKMDDDIAKKMEELIREMYGKTVALLRQHNAALLKTVKVLLNQKEISGDEIDYILDNYPPETPTSLVLEEQNPGSLPFLEEEQATQSKEVDRITPC